MAGSSSRLNGSKTSIFRVKYRFGRLQFPNEHFVHAMVAPKGKIVWEIGEDLMGVGTRLSFFVHARARTLNFGAMFTQFPINLNRQRGEAATSVIRHQNALTGLVHRQM